MAKMKTLIVYQSTYGQTEKIAFRIRDVIESRDTEASAIPVERMESMCSITDFEQVVIGSPIYRGNHAAEIANFIEKFRESLNDKRTAFFSVSASAAGDKSQRDNATQCMEDFLSRCGLEADTRTIFGGGLPYQKYDWVTRLVMKWISWRADGPTDTSMDHELTDWRKVDEFADLLIANVNSLSDTTEAV